MPRKEVLKPGAVQVQSESGKVTLYPKGIFGKSGMMRMTAMSPTEFTLPQLRQLIAALQKFADDMEVEEVHES